MNFTFLEFTGALVSGVLSIIALSAAYIGFFRTRINGIGKIALSIGGLLLISTDWLIMAAGAALVLSVFWKNTRHAAEASA